MAEKSRVFIDSSYFIALYNENDSLHEKAIVIGKRLEQKGVVMVTSSYVFNETVTVLSQRVGRNTALLVGRYFQEEMEVPMMWIDEDLHALAWQIFEKVGDKDISFTDCSIIAVMQAEHIKNLLTFDKHFLKMKKFYRFSLFHEPGDKVMPKL